MCHERVQYETERGSRVLLKKINSYFPHFADYVARFDKTAFSQIRPL